MDLRPATRDDAELLLSWYNDPLTRENSRSRDATDSESHTAWLIKSLALPTRKLFIAEVDGMPVGTVRADEDGEGYAEVSYTVAPEARGQGYGRLMVMQFAREQLAGKKLKAEIKKGGNEASEGIAQALGLKPSTERPSGDPQDPRPLVLWK